LCRRFLLCGGFSGIGGEDDDDDDKSGTIGGGSLFSTVVGDVIFGSVGVVHIEPLSLLSLLLVGDDGETISTTFVVMLDIVPYRVAEKHSLYLTYF